MTYNGHLLDFTCKRTIKDFSHCLQSTYRLFTSKTQYVTMTRKGYSLDFTCKQTILEISHLVLVGMCF